MKFRTRGAATKAALSGAGWSAYYVASGAAIATPNSRWLEIEATLTTVDGANTPTLKDLRVNWTK